MNRCQNCSAPLPAFQGRCEYCGAGNDVDRELLPGVSGLPGDAVASAGETSPFPCPACGAAMQALELGNHGGGPLRVDQCGQCFGLFFPFYKLEAVLNDISKYGFLIDARRLEDLSRNGVAETRIAYRKCPVCAKIMNRINFGQRSGVVTDQCHGHGVWLDSGELKRLVEWRNSGGQLHDDLYRKQQEAERLKREAREKEKLARLKREARAQEGEG
jgi:Zn-finger nucleic acid-binding protein